ncbi:hypothetical protein QUC31_000091 [Theobroma cacao]
MSYSTRFLWKPGGRMKQILNHKPHKFHASCRQQKEKKILATLKDGNLLKIQNFEDFAVNPSPNEKFDDLVRFITVFLLVRGEFLEIIQEGRYTVR